MTFRCEACKELSLPGEPAFPIVTRYKDYDHPYRIEANRDGSDDPGGQGQQIASEVMVCEACLETV